MGKPFMCPSCGSNVVEVDKAVRLNILVVEETGAVYAYTGDADFEHQSFRCLGDCGDLPYLRVEIEDWI